MKKVALILSIFLVSGTLFAQADFDFEKRRQETERRVAEMRSRMGNSFFGGEESAEPALPTPDVDSFSYTPGAFEEMAHFKAYTGNGTFINEAALERKRLLDLFLSETVLWIEAMEKSNIVIADMQKIKALLEINEFNRMFFPGQVKDYLLEKFDPFYALLKKEYNVEEGSFLTGTPLDIMYENAKIKNYLSMTLIETLQKDFQKIVSCAEMTVEAYHPNYKAEADPMAMPGTCLL